MAGKQAKPGRGILASQVAHEAVDRLWHGILIRKGIGMIGGPSGLGKSTAAFKIAADFSQSYGRVIISSKEDARSVQRDRLEAAGGDIHNVIFDQYDIPRDIDALEREIVAEGIGLVVMDTAAKHIAAPIDKADHKAAQALSPLADMCDRTGCTVLFIAHTYRNIKAKGSDPLSALPGGLANTARFALLFGADPADATRLVLTRVKDSYESVRTPTNGYRAIAFEWDAVEFIDPIKGTPYEVGALRIAEKEVSIGDPLATVRMAKDGDGKSGPSAEKRAEAAEFLSNALAAGPLPVEPRGAHVCLAGCGYTAGDSCPKCAGQVTTGPYLKGLVESEGLSWGTILRAQEVIGVVKGRKPGPNPKKRLEGSIAWWRLPDGHPKLHPNAPVELP